MMLNVPLAKHVLTLSAKTLVKMLVELELNVNQSTMVSQIVYEIITTQQIKKKTSSFLIEESIQLFRNHFKSLAGV